MSVSRSFRAEKGEMTAVYNFIAETLGAKGTPEKYLLLMQMSADEIFTNIVEYGYRPLENGGREKNVVVELDVTDGLIRLAFSDHGIPFDPLAAPTPDVTLDVEDRPFGGLGLHIVKSSMDDVAYERNNDRNILTLTKKME
jgi:anti-sigma regulatory factor (Ser/Thr protein kinase)